MNEGISRCFTDGIAREFQSSFDWLLTFQPALVIPMTFRIENLMTELRSLVALLWLVGLCQVGLSEEDKDWKQYNYDNVGWRFNRAEDRLNIAHRIQP